MQEDEPKKVKAFDAKKTQEITKINGYKVIHQIQSLKLKNSYILVILYGAKVDLNQ